MEEKVPGIADSQRLLSGCPDCERANYSSISPASSSTHCSDHCSQKCEVNMSAPVDKFHFVYAIFYLLGMASLLPWNFFITANDYWMYKLQDNSTTSSSPTEPSNTSTSSPSGETSIHYNKLQSLFQNAISLSSMLPNVVFQFLSTILQEKISERSRMLGSIFFIIVVFVFTEVLVKVDTSEWQEVFFIVTMASAVLANCFIAVFLSSIFGMAANLPPRYMQAVMAGQGMGGLFAAVAMIAAISVSSHPTDSAFIYFLVAIIILVLAAFSYVMLRKNEYYQHFSRKCFDCCDDNQDKADCKLPLKISDGDVTSCRSNGCHGDEREVWRKRDVGDDAKDKDMLEEVRYTQATPSSPILLILKQIWPHCFATFYVLFITLSCFPSITASILSSSPKSTWSTLYFTPVVCFLLFNLTDWIGRSMAGYIHMPSEDNVVALLLLVLLRTAFPVLFAFCNVQPRTSPVLFMQDAYFIVFMVLFGLSNGHLGTLAVQYGPRKVDAAHAQTAGRLLSFAFALGLAAGAGFSFVIKMVI